MKKLFLLTTLLAFTSCSMFSVRPQKNPEASFVEIESPAAREVITGTILKVSGKCNGDFDLVLDLQIIDVTCTKGRFSQDIDLSRLYWGVTTIAASSEKGVLHVWRNFLNQSELSNKEYCR